MSWLDNIASIRCWIHKCIFFSKDTIFFQRIRLITFTNNMKAGFANKIIIRHPLLRLNGLHLQTKTPIE